MSCVSSAYEWTEHLRPADLGRAQKKVVITKQFGRGFGVAIGIDDGSIVNEEIFVSACQCQRQNEFQTHIVLHYYYYYATGTSYQRVEYVHLPRAIAMLRPDANLLGDRRKLASGLLDKCYDDIKSRADARTFNAIACITTDGWTNIKNDPVVNYMATSSKFCFFLESVYTGQ
jgi:hypothetical protein